MILQLTQKNDGKPVLISAAHIKFLQLADDGESTLIFGDGFVRVVTEPLGAIQATLGAVKPFQAPMV